MVIGCTYVQLMTSQYLLVAVQCGSLKEGVTGFGATSLSLMVFLGALSSTWS